MANKYYEKNKEKILIKLKARYQDDAGFREKAKETYKKRYHEDETYAAKTVENAKNRYKKLKEVEPKKK